VVGDGNVARGAHEILDALGAHSVSPAELLAGVSDDHLIYRVTFHEEHTVASDTEEFDVSDYHAHPDRYHSVFAPYLDRLTLLVNAMYWHESAPRLASREDLAHADSSLRLIADLSCDIDGGIQATVRATTPDDPVFVYDPTTGGDASGFEGPGVAVLAVDHLPCELPRDASTSFSNALEPWIPDLARADYGQDLPDLNLPPQWHRAVIAHRGELAPAYSHLHTALDVPDA
jgi:alpha-aminoadipic semialdehyde synthase